MYCASLQSTSTSVFDIGINIGIGIGFGVSVSMARHPDYAASIKQTSSTRR